MSVSESPWNLGCYWIGEGPQAEGKRTLSMMTITVVRKWAEAALGPSVLVIERTGARNRVALRFAFDDGIDEIDVATLREFHRRRLRGDGLLRAVAVARLTSKGMLV